MNTSTDEPFRADVDEVLARYGLDDPGHAMLASDLSDAFDEAVEAAAAERDQAWRELRDIRAAIGADEQESTLDEVMRLRAAAGERDALREALGEAIDAMEAHDWGERDGDCTILFASEIDNLRVALAAVPAPDAESAHDKSREAMNEMAADRARYIPPAPDESDELWAGV